MPTTQETPPAEHRALRRSPPAHAAGVAAA